MQGLRLIVKRQLATMSNSGEGENEKPESWKIDWEGALRELSGVIRIF